MKHQKTKTKQAILISIAVAAFLIGLALALLLVTTRARARLMNVEVTFLSPQQALVFWKTPTPSVGFARYGLSRSERSTTIAQTSDQPSDVHAVMIEDIPPDGVYVSLHDAGESRWIIPEVHHVQYHEEELERTEP